MNRNIKNYPQSTVQFLVIFGVFLILERLLDTFTEIDKLHWSVILISKFVLIMIIAVLLNFEKKVRIQNSKIIKGNYNGIFGFIKIEKQFNIISVTDVIIFQNTKNLFEIKVIAVSGEMIIDTFVNRNPALEELERIEKIIKTAVNNRLA